ncbi:MAG: class I SAM-dependent methyltransferase, partial [Planctomycetota bacterium]
DVRLSFFNAFFLADIGLSGGPREGPKMCKRPVDMHELEFAKYDLLGPYHWAATFGPWTRVSPRLRSLYVLAFRAVAAEIRVRGALGLDVGCGEGVMLRMASAAGAEMVGVDLTRTALRLALALCREAGLQSTVLRCDAKSLPFPSETFRFAVCLEVIEHVPDPDALLRELHRVLRPRGVVVLSTPVAEETGALQDPYHVREFRPEEIRAIAERFFPRVCVRGVYPRFLDRIYVRGTGVRALDRIIRGAFKAATRVGLNPYRIAGFRDPAACRTIVAICAKA